MILSEMREQVEKKFGIPVTEAIITVPANFGEKQRSATSEAGKIAGLDVIRMINEPTAAAVAFGVSTGNAKKKETTFVFDMGGGTLDCTIMEVDKTGCNTSYNVLSTSGDMNLGGFNIDHIIGDYIAEKIKANTNKDVRKSPKTWRLLLQEVEQRKKDLTDSELVDFSLKEIYKKANINVEDSDDDAVELSREEVE